MWDAPQKDLLPLPVPHVDSAWWRVSLPPPVWSNSELWRLRNCLHGLNALYSAHPARALAHRAATRSRISCAQRAVIQRVATRIRVYGDPPPDFEPESCLRQLLLSKDLYSQEPQNLAPYSESKLRVLKGDSFPKDAVPLLPPQAGALLQNFRVSIERPWDQVPDDLVLPEPYWDPVLAHNSEKRHGLFRLLLSLRIAGAHLQSKAPAGLFFVWKKDGCIRMVVDGRQANLLQRRPPRVYLGSPNAISELDLSQASLDLGGYGSVAEFELSLADADVRDAYYQFCVRELGSWFSLERVRAGDFDIARAWCDIRGDWVDIDPDSRVWLCVDAMCMDP